MDRHRDPKDIEKDVLIVSIYFGGRVLLFAEFIIYFINQAFLKLVFNVVFSLEKVEAHASVEGRYSAAH